MSIKNRTPEHMRCAIQASCPSVHELEDGRWLIVGKRAECYLAADVPGGTLCTEDGDIAVGDDESAIIISPELLSGVFLNVRQTAEQAEETVSPSEVDD